MMGKKVLLIGGAGYVGSGLVDDLSGHCELTVMDRSVGTVCEGVRTIEADASVFDMTDILSTCECVIHLASESDVRKVGPGYGDGLRVTENIVDCCESAGLKDLMFFSSSAVYGDNGWAASEDIPCDPISDYGLMKSESEAIILSSSLEPIVLRPSNICGGNVTHGVVFDFFHQLILHPDYLRILGNGLQTKDFVHISDVVRFVRMCLDDWVTGVYNISNQDPMDIIDLAHIVVETMGLKDVRFETGQGDRGWEGDVSRCHLLCDRALSKGWHPVYSSRDSVRDAVMSMMGDSGDRRRPNHGN